VRDLETGKAKLDDAVGARRAPLARILTRRAERREAVIKSAGFDRAEEFRSRNDPRHSTKLSTDAARNRKRLCGSA
jgi:hypothetical protein